MCRSSNLLAADRTKSGQRGPLNHGRESPPPPHVPELLEGDRLEREKGQTQINSHTIMSIFLDFDGTITARDTIGDLAKAALRIRSARGVDLDKEWDEVVQSYVSTV